MIHDNTAQRSSAAHDGKVEVTCDSTRLECFTIQININVARSDFFVICVLCYCESVLVFVACLFKVRTRRGDALGFLVESNNTATNMSKLKPKSKAKSKATVEKNQTNDATNERKNKSDMDTHGREQSVGHVVVHNNRKKAQEDEKGDWEWLCCKVRSCSSPPLLFVYFFISILLPSSPAPPLFLAIKKFLNIL